MDEIQCSEFKRPVLTQVQEPQIPSTYQVPDVTLLSHYEESLMWNPGMSIQKSFHESSISAKEVDQVVQEGLYKGSHAYKRDKQVLMHPRLELVSNKENIKEKVYDQFTYKSAPILDESINNSLSDVPRKYNPSSYTSPSIAKIDHTSERSKKQESSFRNILNEMITGQKKNSELPLCSEKLSNKMLPYETPKLQSNAYDFKPMPKSETVKTAATSECSSPDCSISNIHIYKIIEQQNAQILHLQKVLEKVLDQKIFNTSCQQIVSTECANCMQKTKTENVSTQTDWEKPQMISVATITDSTLFTGTEDFLPSQPIRADNVHCGIIDEKASQQSEVLFDSSPENSDSYHYDASSERIVSRKCPFIVSSSGKMTSIYDNKPEDMDEKNVPAYRNLKIHLKQVLKSEKNTVKFHQYTSQSISRALMGNQMTEEQGETDDLQQQLQQLGMSFMNSSNVINSHGKPFLNKRYTEEFKQKILSLHEKDDQSWSDQKFAAIAEASPAKDVVWKNAPDDGYSLSTNQYLVKYGLQYDSELENQNMMYD